VLFPNVPLTGTSDGSTISTPATGLIVWNTGSGGLSPAGFYYNAGSSGSPNWTKVANGAVLTNTLTDGRILIGNASNIATEQAVSGDATISNTGVLDISNNAVETSEINDLAVTTAKIADNAVTGEKIDISGNANGSLMYYNGTDWVNLAPGTSGQILRTNGAAAPTWVNTTTTVKSQNGLNIATSAPNASAGDPYVELGGGLIRNTTITNGAFNMIYNLTGAGDFDIQDNGTSAFFVRDDANVGIGTATPSGKLDVVGSLVTTRVFFGNSTGTYSMFQDVSFTQIDFYSMSSVNAGYASAGSGSVIINLMGLAA
jgi:hypothetical protein